MSIISTLPSSSTLPNSDRRSEFAQSQSLVQALPDAVLVHCNERLVFLNPAALRLLGAEGLPQILGRNTSDFLCAGFISAIEEKISRPSTLQPSKDPLEVEILTLDGSIRHVEGTSIPISWEGQPAIEVVLRDKSDRGKAEDAALEWKKRYELTQRSGLRIGFWQWNMDTNAVEWSDETHRQYGLTPGSFSGTLEDALRQIHPEDRARVQEVVARSINHSGDCAVQFRAIRPDGSICWIDAYGTLVKNGSRKMIGIDVDITDFKKAEESLIESQQKYLLLLNSTAEGIYGLDLNGICTFSNPAAARMFGYTSPEDLLGKVIHREHHGFYPDGTTYPPHDCIVYRSYQKGEGTHSESEYFYRTDGSAFPVEYWSYPIRRDGKVVGCVVTFLDITARRKAEESLRRSEEYYRLLFDQNPQPMWVYDKNSLRFLAVNQAAIDRYGYSREEFLSMTLCDVRPREDVSQFLEYVSKNPPGIRSAGVWRHRAKTGETIFVEITDREIRFQEQSAFLVLATDVTDSLRAEEALKTSEEKYREFVENASFGIYRSTQDGSLLDVNPALVAMLGYESKSELLRCNLGTSIYESAKDRDLALASHDSKDRLCGFVTNWKRKDGTVITVRLNGQRISKDGQVSHYEVIAEDITDRRLLEEQLRQSQKMEAVGRLAGGVAHDFNNALGVITGYSELLQLKLAQDETLHRQAGEIFKAGQKAAALTRQLLAFSRKQTLRPQVLNLNNIVRDMEKMLRRMIGEDIDLVHVGASDLAPVLADPGQVEQVLMNLVVNARDAMPAGGKVRIETANVYLDESVAQKHAYVKPGSYVMLSVQDSGCGMDEKTRSQIFEPFFTTKEIGKGTGLGLSTVYGIVKQSGGYIWVESAPGKGARFHLYLPVTNEIANLARTEQASAPALNFGSETVLVVEDEDALRELTCSALRGVGYHVLEAASAESALAVASQHGGRIHLLLTDVILPGRSGTDLSSSLTALYPEIKTIFMSGYTDDLLGRHRVLTSGVTLLEKPFSNRVLLTKLRELLDAESITDN